MNIIWLTALVLLVLSVPIGIALSAAAAAYIAVDPLLSSEVIFRSFFNFIGIEPEFVRANGVNVARDEGIAGGLAEVEALAA